MNGITLLIIVVFNFAKGGMFFSVWFHVSSEQISSAVGVSIRGAARTDTGIVGAV